MGFLDRAAVGFVFLALGVLAGFYYAYQTDRHALEAATEAKIAAKQSKRAIEDSERAIERAEGAILINCEFGNQNRAAMRRILNAANRQVQSSKQRTAEERAVSRQFYADQLKGLPPFDCEALRLGP